MGLPFFLLSSGVNLGFYQSSFLSHVHVVRSFAPPWAKTDLAARLKAKTISEIISRCLLTGNSAVSAASACERIAERMRWQQGEKRRSRTESSEGSTAVMDASAIHVEVA